MVSYVYIYLLIVKVEKCVYTLGKKLPIVTAPFHIVWQITRDKVVPLNWSKIGFTGYAYIYNLALDLMFYSPSMPFINNHVCDKD